MTDTRSWLAVVSLALLVQSGLTAYWYWRMSRAARTITQWDHFACGLIRTIQHIEGYDKQQVVKNAQSTLRWLRKLEPEERTFD